MNVFTYYVHVIMAMRIYVGYSIEAIPGRSHAPLDKFQSFRRMGQLVDNKSVV